MRLPLEGITVVAIEQAVAAPFASRQLADLGARVIKLERLGGGDFARHYDSVVGGCSSAFVWLNRSKESVAIDLHHPSATDVLDALLGTADVFIQNLAPGATTRLGLDAATLSARHPKLVVCDLSGYGSDGPYWDKKAYDLLIQAEVGLLSITGNEAEPAKAGISIADIAAGMYAFSGVLTALFDRTRTGTVHHVPVSLFGALGEWMSYPMYYTTHGGRQPSRLGATHATIAPYGAFATAEELWILLAVQNNREWHRFCARVLEDASLATWPSFADNESRVHHRAALHEAINARLSTLTIDEAIARLDEAGIANGRLNGITEFTNHPQHASTACWTPVQSPGGVFDALQPPGVPSGLEPRMDPVPELGQHTGAILRELRFSAQHIEALQHEEVIGTTRRSSEGGAQ